MINNNGVEEKIKKNRKNNINSNKIIQNNHILKDNILSYYISKDIPSKKSKIKINEDDFVIPKNTDFNNILEINYNITQLKTIVKKYNLQIKGNKVDLKKSLYNYFYYNSFVIKIQKIHRKVLIKNYIFLHGPGFYNRSLCTNDIDFCTLDKLNLIPFTQFFSFKDINNFIYGYDILSFYNLYKKNSNEIKNPFSTNIIPKSIIINMLNYIKYSKILGFNINLNYDIINDFNESKQLDMKILSLFQYIDNLGNYTNTNWFTSLSKQELIVFFRELFDIWNYRANLTQEIKREIVPPIGNPFFNNLNINVNNVSNFNYMIIKKYLTNVIEIFITKGINDESKKMGCYYILSALTLVNNNAAEAMPWLYEAVMHN